MTIAEKMAEEQSIRLSHIVEMVGREVNAIHLRNGLTELVAIVAKRGIEEACKGGNCNCYACELFKEKVRGNRWWEEEA